MPTMQGFRHRASCIPLTAAVLAIVLAPVVARGAEPDEAQRCQANKLRAAGAELRARLACEAEELATGTTVACSNVAKNRRDDAFERFEARGGCETTGDSGDVGEEIDALLAIARSSLRPGGPAASACTAAQLDLLARASRKLTAAYAYDERSPDPEGLASRLESFQAKFERAFARAVLQGDCLSATDAGTAWGLVAGGVAALRDLVSPTCPCWTTESLEAAFPPGFFDENGRGGAVCSEGEVTGVGSTRTCFLPEPRGPGYHLPSANAAVLGTDYCIFGDLDPGGSGSCAFPFLVSINPYEANKCVTALMASHVVDECP